MPRDRDVTRSLPASTSSLAFLIVSATHGFRFALEVSPRCRGPVLGIPAASGFVAITGCALSYITGPRPDCGGKKSRLFRAHGRSSEVKLGIGVPLSPLAAMACQVRELVDRNVAARSAS